MIPKINGLIGCLFKLLVAAERDLPLSHSTNHFAVELPVAVETSRVLDLHKTGYYVLFHQASGSDCLSLLCSFNERFDFEQRFGRIVVFAVLTVVGWDSALHQKRPRQISVGWVAVFTDIAFENLEVELTTCYLEQEIGQNTGHCFLVSNKFLEVIKGDLDTLLLALVFNFGLVASQHTEIDFRRHLKQPSALVPLVVVLVRCLVGLGRWRTRLDFHVHFSMTESNESFSADFECIG